VSDWDLASGGRRINWPVFARRIGLCRDATRAPRWTRIPQAWVAWAAQAGFLRDRQQSEKSQGFGDGVPELFPDQTETKTVGKSALDLSPNRRFTLNQYIATSTQSKKYKSYLIQCGFYVSGAADFESAFSMASAREWT
jgi:hypothetical protein